MYKKNQVEGTYTKGMRSLLAQAVGVPVSWCSGGQLATMLVATRNKKKSLFPFFPLSSTFLIEGVLGSKKLI